MVYLNKVNNYFINLILIFIFYIGKPATYFKIFSDNIYVFDLILLFLISKCKSFPSAHPISNTLEFFSTILVISQWSVRTLAIFKFSLLLKILLLCCISVELSKENYRDLYQILFQQNLLYRHLHLKHLLDFDFQR